jgi:hypothetical protein
MDDPTCDLASYDLTFTISPPSSSSSVLKSTPVADVELKGDGANIAVTHENKEEYMRLYAEYRMFYSTKKQLDAFHRVSLV